MISTPLPRRHDSLLPRSRTQVAPEFPTLQAHLSSKSMPKTVAPPSNSLNMPLPVRCSSLKASRNASPLLRRHDTMDSPMATMLAKKKASHASVLVKLDDDGSNVAGRQSMSTLDDEDDTASYLTAGEELVPLSPLRLSASSNSSESSESMRSTSSSTVDHPENDPENDENDKGDTNMGEVESALLRWKRKSFLRLAPASQVASTVNLEDCFAALSTTTTLWANDAIFGDMEQVLRQPTIQERCQYAADRLWAEDTAFVPKQQVAMFLGKNELFHHTVRQLYLAKFDFANQRLDDAFRCLCSKVYLKAEAQEIDRILEAFAVRFHAYNQASRLLYNADVVYAIVYSLMLLNTDLHIAPGHARMTKAHFCENTMNTILHNMKSEQLAYLPGGLTLWKQDMLQHLKDLYQSVKVQGILQPSTGKKSSRLLQLPRMSTFKLVAQSSGGDLTSDVGARWMPSSHATSSIQQGIHVPAMEGHVRFRPLNSHPHGQQGKDWANGFLVMKRGCLRLKQEKTLSKLTSIIRPANQRGHGDSAWEIDLTHGFLAHGHGSPRFELHLNHQEDKDKAIAAALEMECADAAQVNAWMACLWFWMAMVSKKPLQAPVSSVIYGWEVDAEELDACTLSPWHPPAVLQQLGTAKDDVLSLDHQIDWIKAELRDLTRDHAHHAQLFSRIMQLPSRLHVKRTMIVTNWHEKNTYLIQQLDKYKHYLRAIEAYDSQRRLLCIAEDDFLNEIHDLFKEIGRQ